MAKKKPGMAQAARQFIQAINWRLMTWRLFGENSYFENVFESIGETGEKRDDSLRKN